MKKAALLGFIAVGISVGAPNFEIVPSIGTGLSSPSSAQYAWNALEALRSGSNSYGSGAARYDRLVGSGVSPVQVIDTSASGVNSWLGLAAPNALYGGEYGNRLYFGLAIVNPTTTFSLSQLVYFDNFYQYDPFNFTSDPVYFNTASDTYDGATIVGINFGGDGALGGGDDTVYSAGESNTLQVNALYYRGVNSAFPLVLDGVGSDQDNLTSLAAAIGSGQIVLTAAYCLTSTPGDINGCSEATASAPSSVSVVPEPSSYALMGLGLLALGYARQRRS